MRDGMSHRERVFAALAGAEVDRPPVSMWRHHFAREHSADDLADAMLAYQRRFDWDFIKVNPRWSYHVEPWGTTVEYPAPDAEPHLVSAPVADVSDWARIEPVGLDHPALAEQLRVLELIGAGIGREVPFLATVFTPVSIAGRLTPSADALMPYLREHTEAMNGALEAICETFTAFAIAALNRGASGLFYATTGFATTDALTPEEHCRLVRRWDLRLLDAAQGAEFNVLHVCRAHNMLTELRDYPVHAFNWDAHGEGNPGLEEGRAALGGAAVIGGVAHGQPLAQASAVEVRAEMGGLRAEMGDRGWMAGPGCTYMPETPEGNVEAVRSAFR
ncbi:MAG: uroporphyrinogen decarboxylase family protein [Dehalococcoidia bacterium]